MPSTLSAAHERRLRPSVMVRMSRFCSVIIAVVAATSAGVICMAPRFHSWCAMRFLGVRRLRPRCASDSSRIAKPDVPLVTNGDIDEKMTERAEAPNSWDVSIAGDGSVVALR